MRYLNWDVLLFAGPKSDASRAPAQEFRTNCFVVDDPDMLLDPRLSGVGEAAYARAVPAPTAATAETSLRGHAPAAALQRQLPCVTCFIASHEPGTPFKVSVHSWGSPKVGEEVARKIGEGKVPAWEVRVLVDGTLSGLSFVNAPPESGPTPWPAVIESSILPERPGTESEQLVWPKFHSEMLTNMTWSAGESLGRIKVVVAEGWRNSEHYTEPFQRVRNLVCFAFQHAPLSHLENTMIAWPNKNMWMNAHYIPIQFPMQALQRGLPNRSGSEAMSIGSAGHMRAVQSATGQAFDARRAQRASRTGDISTIDSVHSRPDVASTSHAEENAPGVFASARVGNAANSMRTPTTSPQKDSNIATSSPEKPEIHTPTTIEKATHELEGSRRSNKTPSQDSDGEQIQLPARRNMSNPNRSRKTIRAASTPTSNAESPHDQRKGRSAPTSKRKRAGASANAGQAAQGNKDISLGSPKRKVSRSSKYVNTEAQSSGSAGEDGGVRIGPEEVGKI